MHDQVAVVLAVEAKFRSNVSHLYPRKWLVILISDGNDEGMKSMIFTLDHELSKYTGMVGKDS